MIKGIFKQMWAQRKSNGWLLMELIVVFVVVWLVIDPLYVIQYQRAIPMGFDYENLYKIDVKMLPNTAPEYSKEDDTQEKLMEDLKRMGNLIKTYPGVEAVVIHGGTHPLGVGYTPCRVFAEGDTIGKGEGVQHMTYLRGWDYWDVYRFTSVTDNKWETIVEIELPPNGVIITKDLDSKLFEKISKENPSYRKSIKKSQKSDALSSPVTGVINYVKGVPFYQPDPIMFEAQDKIDAEMIRRGGVVIAIRVRDGIAGNKFMQEFKEEMEPKLEMRNLRMDRITSFDAQRFVSESFSGTTNTIRTQNILAVFFLTVVFLGVISSFWLKTENRRGEIGLRMALGANRGKIIKRFVMEGWVLVLVSSIIGLIIQLNVVYFNGLTSSSYHKIPEAWPVNNPTAHFTIVTLIVFALLILTVTIGSLFPAYKAANVNPVDALRDE